AMAGILGISRAAVHKHVETLRLAGVAVDSSRGGGYRLSAPLDSVLPEVVLPLLLGADETGSGRPRGAIPSSIGLPYRYFAAMDSTNEALKEIAHHEGPAGALVVTDDQRGGRGRLGRRWISQPGKDLTFSLLLRPRVLPAEAARLVLAAGLAVAEVIERLLGPERTVGIKWPNDVLVDGRKVCGILSEASMDMDRLHWVVIGIGLNVNGRPVEAVSGERSDAWRPAAASLAESAGEVLRRPALLAQLLDALAQRWRQVETGAWESVRDACAERDLLRGTSVVVRSGFSSDSVVTEGTAEGLGREGELLVRGQDGVIRAVRAGEVTLSGP
ncbi:MAG: biotin--[acetyl-CoA-carboxylase] ligase, partial [Thermoleophilia bacterium]|nr:biotin--[acetyl-CoA-carboxylase] ligase [Thermoleophilia bacterium]